MNNRNTSLFCLAALAILPLRLPASDGRIPISALPFTTTGPGVYYLTRDLGFTASVAITIAHNDVTIDLNGHTLTYTGGTPAGITHVATSNVTNYRRMRVTGGHLVGGETGVLLNFVLDSARVDHLLINGLASGFNSRGIYIYAGGGPTLQAAVEDNVIALPDAGNGIQIANATVRVTGNQIAGDTGNFSTCYGINLEGPAAGVISGNAVQRCNQGIYLNAALNLQVDGNEISVLGDSARAVYLGNSTGDRITNNILFRQSGGASTGIALIASYNSLIRANNLSGFNAGISLTSTSMYNFLENNNIAGSTANGVYVEATSCPNALSHNYAQGATGFVLNGCTASARENLGGCSAPVCY
jgi:parallel beta-helix repeat protein